MNTRPESKIFYLPQIPTNRAELKSELGDKFSYTLKNDRQTYLAAVLKTNMRLFTYKIDKWFRRNSITQYLYDFLTGKPNSGIIELFNLLYFHEKPDFTADFPLKRNFILVEEQTSAEKSFDKERYAFLLIQTLLPKSRHFLASQILVEIQAVKKEFEKSFTDFQILYDDANFYRFEDSFFRNLVLYSNTCVFWSEKLKAAIPVVINIEKGIVQADTYALGDFYIDALKPFTLHLRDFLIAQMGWQNKTFKYVHYPLEYVTILLQREEWEWSFDDEPNFCYLTAFENGKVGNIFEKAPKIVRIFEFSAPQGLTETQNCDII